jgi:hypothetical protein
MRSRGELVLEALDHWDAREAAGALVELDARSYRAFNLIVADNRDIYWLKGLGPDGPGAVERHPVPAGLSMITASDRNDRTSADRTYCRNSRPQRSGLAAIAAWEALSPPGSCAGRGPGTPTIVTDYGFAPSRGLSSRSASVEEDMPHHADDGLIVRDSHNRR